MVQQMAGLPGGSDALARVVRGDPSDDVALAAAYILRRAAMGKVVGLLDGRLASGKRDPAARERMLREIERHQVFAAGQSLPHFLRDAPPPFTVKGASRRNVRVLAFGDFGDGSERQTRMAEAMARFHAKTPFDFAVTLGDNFYPAGMAEPRRSALATRLRAALRADAHPLLPVAGQPRLGAGGQPRRRDPVFGRSRSVWQMPADRYTFIAGPVQFFAIDTNLITRAQLEWLDRELGRSKARWKIVYAHHPIYSYGLHGDDAGAARQPAAGAARAREHLPRRPRSRSAAHRARRRRALRRRGRRRRLTPRDHGRVRVRSTRPARTASRSSKRPGARSL